jgi:allantoin racemase
MPIFGMGTSSYMTAAALGERFGVISVVSAAIRRHKRAVRALRLLGQPAGDIAIDMTA